MVKAKFKMKIKHTDLQSGVVTIEGRDVEGVCSTSPSPEARQCSVALTVSLREIVAREIHLGQVLYVTVSTEEEK